jgi:hypothetical protein
MVRRFSHLLRRWPVEKMISIACAVGIFSLVVGTLGILAPVGEGAAWSPLLVVLSMSLSQGLGVLAGLMFALSIAAEAGRGP